MDGVAREIVDQVYRYNITHKICKYFYNNDPECLSCCMVEETIDLRTISPMSYSSGDRIIGCLEKLGRVVIRGIRIQNATYEASKTIADSENNGRLTQKPYLTSIEDVNSNRVMKYKHSSIPHTNWSQEGHCCKFLKEIKTHVLDRILNGDNYIVGKFNLIKNNGDVPLDQQAHTEYQPRKAK